MKMSEPTPKQKACILFPVWRWERQKIKAEKVHRRFLFQCACVLPSLLRLCRRASGKANILDVCILRTGSQLIPKHTLLANETRATATTPNVANGQAFPRTLGNFKHSKFGTEAPTSLSHFLGKKKPSKEGHQKKTAKAFRNATNIVAKQNARYVFTQTHLRKISKNTSCPYSITPL